MSFAVRNDNLGFRRIESKDDVQDGEFYSEIMPSLSGLPLAKDEVERKRLYAYADPITGCDRFFSEALRLESSGAPLDDIKAARTAGAARFAEIQEQIPWPEA